MCIIEKNGRDLGLIKSNMAIFNEIHIVICFENIILFNVQKLGKHFKF